MKIIGVDAHSTTCEVAVLSSSGKGELVMHRTVPTNGEILIDCIAEIPGKKELVLEESEIASWLRRTLNPYVDKVIVAEPRENKWIANTKLSNDKVDAIRLAKLHLGGYIKEVYHPEDGRQRFKELVLSYHDLDKQVIRFKNKIKAKYRQNGIFPKGETVYNPKHRDKWLDNLPDNEVVFQATKLYKIFDLITLCKEQTRRKIIKMSKKYPEISKFQQIPGIGPIISATVSAIIDTPFRFSKRNKVWAYARLGLGERESAGHWKPGGRQHLSKDGNRILKKMIMTAVESILRSRDNSYKQKFYNLVLNKHVDSSLAKLTIGRCILSTMMVMWKKGEDYKEKKLNFSIS